jgi:ABC-type glycerol-3-phosphate transport system substrate-binding protein
MIARCTRAAVISVALALIIAACGGGATSPGPVTPPPGGEGGTPPPNSAPVIDSIELSAARTEVDSEVTITAHVRDAETPPDQLKYEWKADAGTPS